MSFLPKTYTVESVTRGHPDKLCDAIADRLLDEYLRGDKHSRVAIEVLGGHKKITVAGEVTSKTKVDVEGVVRELMIKAGYGAWRHPSEALAKEDDVAPYKIEVDLVAQSPEIAHGVDTGGAGDQGIMYGFATNETEDFLPKGLVLAHALARQLEKARTDKTLPWLGPDGKTQVTMSDDKPTVIVISTQHSPDISLDQVRKEIRDKIIFSTLKKTIEMPKKTEITEERESLNQLRSLRLLINPAGHFTIGGFDSDTGLTGRKTQVDSYGGLIPHGGGCFSGKDATKVDRSGAYMARFAAKNIVANNYAKECLVSVAYAIGEEKPVMLTAMDEKGRDLTKILTQHFDFRPRAIIEKLDLTRPIFAKSTCYGHFGRADLPWEEIIQL